MPKLTNEQLRVKLMDAERERDENLKAALTYESAGKTLENRCRKLEDENRAMAERLDLLIRRNASLQEQLTTKSKQAQETVAGVIQIFTEPPLKQEVPF